MVCSRFGNSFEKSFLCDKVPLNRNCFIIRLTLFILEKGILCSQLFSEDPRDELMVSHDVELRHYFHKATFMDLPSTKSRFLQTLENFEKLIETKSN